MRGVKIIGHSANEEVLRIWEKIERGRILEGYLLHTDK